MTGSPLTSPILFQIGPVPFATPVVVTWGLMASLTAGGWVLTRRLAVRPGKAQAAVELVVEGIATQIQETLRTGPDPFLPLIGMLFLFILTANWSSLIPGIEPPTANLETDAALALIVFGAMVWFGVRARGVRGYLRGFADGGLLMVPLNLMETVTRTFSLLVRLFGNVMGGVFVIGIVLSLAGLLVPVPLMALELLVGGIQAYIFCALALVFIGGAMGQPASPGKDRS